MHRNEWNDCLYSSSCGWRFEWSFESSTWLKGWRDDDDADAPGGVDKEEQLPAAWGESMMGRLEAKLRRGASRLRAKALLPW
mmetsp:Transcript_1278/g.2816  ORF Transcript_1278/g.2816 Transcript_1278/m.2816 type:complete len:82 (+) Transcript_1278:120-365(+)